jgi:hypothetical protein
MRANFLSTLALTAVLAITGCSISENGSSKNKDVKIDTPFGGMNVKTNDAANLADIGLGVYPGSTRVKEDKDSSTADVDMHFGDFRLRVKAAGFRTADSPEKVKAYYLKELAKFGDVIECRGKQSVGKPGKTSEGLGCDDSEAKTKVHVNGMADSANIELKAGSKLHQHIVCIENESAGTKYGLVALDLPKTEKESN